MSAPHAEPRRPRLVERLRRQFDEAADALGLSGPDAGLDLAGRFGVRRFFERHDTSDPDVQQGPWLQRAREMRKAAHELSRALSAEGLRHFFFKGIALVGRFYRIEERLLADVDLFIAPADRNSVLAALHALGYAQLGDGEPGTERPGLTMTRGSDVLLDVHWGLEATDRTVQAPAVTLPPFVWSGVEVQGGLAVPQDEHHAALVLHHWARHDLDHIRGLLDFALLWDAVPHAGGADLSEVARHLGVARVLGAAGRAVGDGGGVYTLRG
ncbi:MAG: nucleotidyltransferase family protein, partial [Gemmatimonadales bacterium]